MTWTLLFTDIPLHHTNLVSFRFFLTPPVHVSQAALRSGRKRVRVVGNTIIFFEWNITVTDYISRHIVPEAQRMDFVDTLFGIHFPLKLEPTVFRFAEQLAAPTYNGGYWQFFALSNGGYYMAPRSDTIFKVNADNGFSGRLSGDALGITACLYAYSHLSFGDGAFAETCADHYHLLREYIFGHPEVKAILAAID